MKDNKKSELLKKAVMDAKELFESATASAKEEIAKELPEKFHQILEGEIKKIKKESVNESNNDDVSKEPIMVEGKTDNTKESMIQLWILMSLRLIRMKSILMISKQN
jgi:hypothetical protein